MCMELGGREGGAGLHRNEGLGWWLSDSSKATQLEQLRRALTSDLTDSNTQRHGLSLVIGSTGLRHNLWGQPWSPPCFVFLYCSLWRGQSDPGRLVRGPRAVGVDREAPSVNTEIP